MALVLGFRSSSNLAAAYGVAVTTTMAITTVLMSVVAHERWGWGVPASAALAVLFLVPDLAFFGANILKIPHGGWFPLLVAAIVFTLLTTWRRGREILNERMRDDMLATDVFLKSIAHRAAARVKGTAVYMSRTPDGVPPALLHNLKHNKVLHERIVFFTVVTEERPYVRSTERMSVEELGHGFYRVIARYGFMEDLAVPVLLKRLNAPGLEFPPGDTSFFLGKETIFASRRRGMAMWRERLFALMSRNARSATLFFRLPVNRVVELGSQIEI
jgi:KUP system potassium uptake protein